MTGESVRNYAEHSRNSKKSRKCKQNDARQNLLKGQILLQCISQESLTGVASCATISFRSFCCVQCLKTGLVKMQSYSAFCSIHNKATEQNQKSNTANIFTASLNFVARGGGWRQKSTSTILHHDGDRLLTTSIGEEKTRPRTDCFGLTCQESVPPAARG